MIENLIYFLGGFFSGIVGMTIGATLGIQKATRIKKEDK